MRITLLTHATGRGGSNAMLLQLHDFLSGRGHAVSVVAGDATVAPPDRSRTWREDLQTLGGRILDLHPDVVYSFSGRRELDVLRILPLARARHVFSLERHEWADIDLWLKQASGFVEMWTANTPDVLDHIRKLDPSRVSLELAPYAVDPCFRQRAATGPRSGVLHVAYAGRLERFQKRSHWLPRIAALCRKAGREIQWHVFGEGPARAEMERDAGRLALRDAFLFHGWLEPEALAESLAACDVFFLCSRWEGLPLALVEAMLCGLACVVPSGRGGMAYALAATGWLYDARSPRSGAEALLRATSDTALLRERGAASRARALEIFSGTVVERQLLALEQRLLGLRFNGRIAPPSNIPRLRNVRWPARLRRLARAAGLVKD